MDVIAEQYEAQLRQLLPSGPAWEGALGAVLRAEAEGLSRVHQRVDVLRAEADPRTALETLPEWEARFGLPDACSVGEPTLQERRSALVARVTDLGGARIPRFLQIAAALGYPTARVERFRYHTCEMSCEEPVADIEWRFAWAIHLDSSTRVVESTCESGVDEPLMTWGDATIACILQREAPSQSVVMIKYRGVV